MSKEQIEELWHNIKAKTADLSLGYGLEIL